MKTNRLLKSGAVALALFSLLAAPARAQTATFTNAFGDGIWQRDEHIGVIGNPNDPSTLGNWDTGAYPNNHHRIQDPNTGFFIPGSDPLYDVVIALPITCTLGSNVGVTIQTLNVFNGSTLDIAGGSVVAIANGTLTNNGSILVNSTDPANSTGEILFEASALITGSGNIQLDGLTYNRAVIALGSGLATVTNDVSHTIHGQGDIFGFFTGGILVNNGTIHADVNGGAYGLALDLAFVANKNNSLIEATNGGLLNFGTGTIDQTGGGTFLADGANSLISLGSPFAIPAPQEAIIIGGTLNTTNGGVINGLLAVLTGCTNNGAVQIPGNDIIVVTGTGLTNNGTVTINDGTGSSTAQLRFDASGTLGGTGSILLNGFGSNFNVADFDTNGQTVTIGAGQTLHGHGTILSQSGLLINNGTIAGDDPTGNMQVDLVNNSGFINKNNSLIEAINGAVLGLYSGLVDQTGGGTFLADGKNSIVQLGGGGFAIVGGGILNTANNGIIEANGAGVELEGCTNNGTVQIPGGEIIVVAGTGLTNNGTILVDTAADNLTTKIRFDASGTLDGNGSVRLNRIGTDFNVADFDTNGQTVTIGAGQTLHGHGTILSQCGLLINNGTIAGDDPTGNMQVDLVNNSGFINKNNSLIEAIIGAVLGLYSGLVDQTGGGTFLADGNNSIVQLGGGGFAIVVGGILNTANNGIIEANGAGVELEGCTNNGTVQIPVGNIIVVTNSLTNNGSILVNPTGDTSATTTLRFDANTQLDGTGKVLLNGPNFNTADFTVSGNVTVTNGDLHRSEERRVGKECRSRWS